MNSKRKMLIITVALVLTNLVTAVFLVKALWANRLWESQMFGMAKYAGSLQASTDFQTGKLRFYELIEDGNLEFANRYNGPFEIWHWPYYPIIFGGPHKYTEEMFIEAYNSTMQYRYDHPKKFKTHPNNTAVQNNENYIMSK